MRRAFATFAACVFAGLAALSAPPVFAAEMPASLRTELLALYDRYNAAAKAGDMKAALALRTSKRRAEANKSLANPKERDFVMAIMKVVPDSYTVEHAELSADGSSAEIETVASATLPPQARGKNGVPADGRIRQEIALAFVKEQGAWRFDIPTYGANPDDIKPCDEKKASAEADFNPDQGSSMGGMIRRVVFAERYTVFVARIVDQENCFYLPNRAALQKAGLDTSRMVPRAIFEADVIAHRSDKQRVWVDGITIK